MRLVALAVMVLCASAAWGEVNSCTEPMPVAVRETIDAGLNSLDAKWADDVKAARAWLDEHVPVESTAVMCDDGLTVMQHIERALPDAPTAYHIRVLLRVLQDDNPCALVIAMENGQ